MSKHNVFPKEELNQRLSNVRSQMVGANVDGVVITIPALAIDHGYNWFSSQYHPEFIFLGSSIGSVEGFNSIPVGVIV